MPALYIHAGLKLLLALAVVGYLIPMNPVDIASSSQLGLQTWKSNDAIVTFSPKKQTWVLQNAKIRVVLGFDNRGYFGLIQISNLVSKHNWDNRAYNVFREQNCVINNRSFFLKNKSVEKDTTEFSYDSFTVTKEAHGAEVLTIKFQQTDLALNVYYVIYPQSAVIERWAELNNATGQKNIISRFDSLNLSLQTDAEKIMVYSITGLSQHLPYGDHIPHPSFIFQETVLAKDTIDIYSGTRSSERNLAWIALQPAGSKEGIFAGIEWSGESRFICTKEMDSFTLSAGLTNLNYDLGKNSRFVSPKVFFGVYSGTVDNASQETHQFCRAYLTPKVPVDFPWVMYNTWFSYGIDQDETRMKKEIDHAKEMGLEGFYLDAGWYQLSPVPAKPGNFDFSPGVGLWKENKEKYPAGIRALSDYCHQQGLKFGIWIEPERVDDGTRDKQFGPWTDLMLAKHNNQVITTDDKKTMLICLGNPEAREWVKHQISYVIETYNIDWLKWDNNLWGICNRSDHGHQTGDGNYAQIQGLYTVLDYLHQKYPELIIENCASGGNRMDFGIMQRTQVFWVHDDSYTSYVCRYHHYGSAFAFPPEYLNSWVIQDGDFTRALGQNKTIPKPTLDYIFRSRMLGAFGISLRTLDTHAEASAKAGWSPELKLRVKEEIETYKQLRKYLKGEFSHLTSQTVIYNKTWEPPKSWEVFQYRLKDESVVFYFRDDDDNDTFLIHPQGINSSKKYQITFLDSKEKRIVAGAQLVKQGLELKLVDRLSSGIVLIKSK